MPQRRLRSSSLKKREIRTRTGVHVRSKRKAQGKPRCVCGRVLNSVSGGRGKGPSRPYGGSLCPICARRRVLELTRRG